VDTQSTYAIILRCALDGTVQEIIANSGMLLTTLKPGESFIQFISPGSIDKALRLLKELRTGAGGVSWELNVALEKGIQALRFSGFRDGDVLFIGAAIDDTATSSMQQDLLRMATDQATALRSVIKRQYDLALEQFQHGRDRYDELSQLNNELINLQRDLLRKNHELERLNTFKDELLGMAAHDLRTPLSVIALYSQYLLEETETEISDEQADLVREIVDASDFMYKLVSNLLDLATIEAGRLQLECQAVDLAAMIAHNARLNSTLAQRKSIRIVIDISPELPPVYVDAVKIEQVLNNLLANAVKFSPTGSTLFVAGHPFPVASGEMVAVTIQDQGPGISEEQGEKLFQPFSRLSSRAPGGEKNSGLGLAISRRIVEGHGGQIWLKGKVGEGAAFTFTLPIASGDEAQLLVSEAHFLEDATLSERQPPT
jgi:signal transduction histidine kinase